MFRSLGAVLYELCTCEHAFQGNVKFVVVYLPLYIFHRI